MTGATQKRLCVRGFAWRRTVGLLLTTLLLLLALCACSGREHVEDGDGLNNPGSTETDGQEMKSLTEPTLSLTLTVPAAWDDIAELSACDKGTAYLGYGIMLFHLSEKNALPFNFPCFTTHPQSRTTFADLGVAKLTQYHACPRNSLILATPA